jgi:hypothetical protein
MSYLLGGVAAAGRRQLDDLTAWMSYESWSTTHQTIISRLVDDNDKLGPSIKETR